MFDHDFSSLAVGVLIAHELYELNANTGLYRLVLAMTPANLHVILFVIGGITTGKIAAN